MYAGLAAFYLIRDADDTGAEPNPIGIPGGRYEIPLVIQDRTFTGTGELQSDDRGFKDTVAVNPGVVTRIRSAFALPSGVTGTQKDVFHCHILEHEDNDMMRPYEVVG